MLFCHNCQIVIFFLFLGWDSQTLDEEQEAVVAFLRDVERGRERVKGCGAFSGGTTT